MSARDARALDPFALTADPSAYVPSPERERALEQMLSALATGAVPCLEGPTGIGKTLLLQLVVRRAADRFLPLYLPYPALSTQELCRLALGLLERRSGHDPETALLDLAADLALQGRPLLLLIDDAASLPADTGRGLAQLLARAQGALRIVLAGIDSAELLLASAAFGDAVRRVALHEGIVGERLREYVAAQLELAHAPRSLREAFDDAALAELGRVAEGNPRRLHIAAQSIARRAGSGEGHGTWPSVVAAAAPAPSAAPDVPREMPPEPVPVSLGPAAIPEPPEPEPGAATAPAPPADAADPPGEYRYVRGRTVAEGDGESSRMAPAERPHETQLPPAEVDWTLAALAQSPEPTPMPEPAAASVSKPAPAPRPSFDPPWIEPPKRAAAKPVASARGGGRSPSVVIVALVAAASAVVGFALVTGFTHENGVVSEWIDRLTGSNVEDVAPEAVSEVAPEAPPAAPPSFPAAVAEPRIDVSINASPWASVEIDGEAVGDTPLGGVPLTPGRHHFRLRFPDGSVRERAIRIDEDHRAIVFE